MTELKSSRSLAGAMVESSEGPDPSGCLRLLAKLEESLKDGHQALLARNVNLLERLTEEELFILRRLSKVNADGGSRDFWLGAMDENGAFATRVQAVATRVLHLGRVHLALLDRADKQLRTLSRFLAGSQSEYRPVRGKDHVVATCLNSLSPKEGPRCQG